jgi:hypothetical protein
VRLCTRGHRFQSIYLPGSHRSASTLAARHMRLSKVHALTIGFTCKRFDAARAISARRPYLVLRRARLEILINSMQKYVTGLGGNAVIAGGRPSHCFKVAETFQTCCRTLYFLNTRIKYNFASRTLLSFRTITWELSLDRTRPNFSLRHPEIRR